MRLRRNLVQNKPVRIISSLAAQPVVTGPWAIARTGWDHRPPSSLLVFLVHGCRDFALWPSSSPAFGIGIGHRVVVWSGGKETMPPVHPSLDRACHRIRLDQDQIHPRDARHKSSGHAAGTDQECTFRLSADILPLFRSETSSKSSF